MLNIIGIILFIVFAIFLITSIGLVLYLFFRAVKDIL